MDDPEAIFQEGWLLCDVGEHELGLARLQRAVAKGYFVAPTLARRPPVRRAARRSRASRTLLARAEAGPRSARWPRSARRRRAAARPLNAAHREDAGPAGDRDELLRRLRSLRPDSARRWGRMSAAPDGVPPRRRLRHGARTRSRSRRGPASCSGRSSNGSRSTLRCAGPPASGRSPEIDQLLPQCTAPVRFDVDLSRVETLLDELPALGPTFEWPHHPIFGRLSASDWFRWGYLHTDHHLRQFGV